MLGVGLAIVGILALVAIFAPLLVHDDPRAFAFEPLLAPSAGHLLGTDDSGRDVFARLVYGTRVTMVVAPVTALLTVALGCTVGLAASLTGRIVSTVVMRIVDTFMAVPKLPLLLLLSVTVGSSLEATIISMVLVFWPFAARVSRSQTLSLRSRQFVTAARGFGGGPLYIARRHLVPALSPVLITQLVVIASIAAVFEAGLAFLGLGDPGRLSWGTMINDATSYPGIFSGPAWLWLLLPPSLALSVAVLGFSFIGVGLEPRLNSRLGAHVA